MKSKLPVIILSVLLVVCVGIAFILINQQTSTIASMEESESKLKSEVETLKEENSTLNADVAEKDTMISGLTSETTDLNEAVSKLESNLEDALSNLEETSNTLEYELSLKEKWAKYILPEDIIGEWSVVTSVDVESDFDPNAGVESKWLKSVRFSSNTVMFNMGEGYSNSMPWIDDHILGDDSAMGYRIEEINGKDYLFLEWKSGDYLRESMISYYVLERMN